MAAMIAKVSDAFVARGFLKNEKALLMASTPVNDDEPDEKALNRTCEDLITPNDDH